jgi:hypothetical protein
VKNIVKLLAQAGFMTAPQFGKRLILLHKSICPAFAAFLMIGIILGLNSQFSLAGELSETAPANVERVDQMPRIPVPYSLRNWEEVCRDYVGFVFDVNKKGEFLPLMRWDDVSSSKIWMPSYVGDPDGPEGINYLAAVLTGTLVGLDMRSYRGHDWVLMATNFFNPTDGICLNSPAGGSGGSMWYDVFPNVLFFQLGAEYLPDPARERMMHEIATRFYDECVVLGGRTNPPALPDFDHTGFNLREMIPFDNGERIEPEGAAGIAWIEYMAWHKFHDPRFLTAADWCLQALEQKPLKANPLYEVLLPYAVITAVRLNSEESRNHDVAKLLNWCFVPRPEPQARPNWGVITGRWSGLDVGGLVGSSTDGGGYAFAMNTFQYAGTLAPLARYDPRYARDLGRWLLNVANSSRLFYANAFDEQHQSSYAWASKYDPNSVIAYEGLRRWKRGWVSAAADYRTASGKVVLGSFASTRYYHEVPLDVEVLEESPGSNYAGLSHIWQFNLPNGAPEKYLVVAADRIAGAHRNNSFCFSYSTNAAGPFVNAFCVVSNSEPPHVAGLSDDLNGHLYVKVESTDHTPGQFAADRLSVDAMAISYRSDTGPFAQGDQVVSWVDLVKNYTVPIVLYRLQSVITDLGLYGSSHVGMLGGVVKPTNVERILQWDLLKTDFFHKASEPTFLYYNPYDKEREVKLNVGPEVVDIVDKASNILLVHNARGTVKFAIPPDAARVIGLRQPGH